MAKNCHYYIKEVAKPKTRVCLPSSVGTQKHREQREKRRLEAPSAMTLMVYRQSTEKGTQD